MKPFILFLSFFCINVLLQAQTLDAQSSYTEWTCMNSSIHFVTRTWTNAFSSKAVGYGDFRLKGESKIYFGVLKQIRANSKGIVFQMIVQATAKKPGASGVYFPSFERVPYFLGNFRAIADGKLKAVLEDGFFINPIKLECNGKLDF